MGGRPQVGGGNRQVSGDPTSHRSNGSAHEQDKDISKSNSENNNDRGSDLMELQRRSEREFYKDRKIIVRNVPPVTYEEVRGFMGGHPVCNISISKKSRHAVVTLLNGEQALEIARQLDGKHLLGTEVSVTFYPSDRLLCVAHLPPHFTDEEFHALVAGCGPVAKCYLKRDENTGESQGYGFVEYCVNREKSTPARDELDEKIVRDRTLHCDFVNGNQEDYSQLSSRCLLVENLPKQYRNVTELRELFSHFTSPAYCRILVKENDISMGTAIVEYAESNEAAKICRHLTGHKIAGAEIRITFCVLGKTAVDIYNRLMTKPDGKSQKSGAKPSLLPDPIFPHESLLSSPLVKSLTDLNPQLMTKFTAALQELQVSYAQQIHKTNKRGLLGPAPTMMNPLMSPNMQLGLLVMLALRMHVRMGFLSKLPNDTDKLQLNLLTLLDSTQPQNGLQPSKPSLLGDPFTAQARILVQNLMSQLLYDMDIQNSFPDTSPEQDDTSRGPKHDPADKNIRNLNINWLLSLGQYVVAIQGNLQQAPTPLMRVVPGNGKNSSLLGDASEYFSNHGVEKKVWENQIHQAVKSKLLGEPQPANTKAGTADCNENYLQNLQVMAAQYSGSMGYRPGANMSGNPGSNFGHNPYIQPGQNTGPVFPTNQFQSFPINSHSDKRKGLLQTPMGLKTPVASQYAYSQNNNYEMTSNYSLRPDQQQLEMFYNTNNNTNYKTKGDNYPTQPGQHSLSAEFTSNKANAYLYDSKTFGNSGYRPSDGNPPLNPLLVNFNKGIAPAGDINSNGINVQSYSATSERRRQNFGPIGQKTARKEESKMTTPVGQKRSYSHLLPAPEASPEGDYVGQHSQGIGGHYTESHIAKRRRYNENFNPPQSLF